MEQEFTEVHMKQFECRNLYYSSDILYLQWATQLNFFSKWFMFIMFLQSMHLIFFRTTMTFVVTLFYLFVNYIKMYSVNKYKGGKWIKSGGLPPACSMQYVLVWATHLRELQLQLCYDGLQELRIHMGIRCFLWYSTRDKSCFMCISVYLSIYIDVCIERTCKV